MRHRRLSSWSWSWSWSWLWLAACGCAGSGGSAASMSAEASSAAGAGATAGGAVGPAGFAARAGDIAIRDATLVPMAADGEVAHQTVVIRGDRIAAIAPAASVRLPAGVTVIDGAGKWLMPGLADMHVHTWHDDDRALFLAAGVTTIRNMWGVPRHVVWRDQIARGELLGPTIVTSGSLIDGEPPDWAGSVVLTRPEAAEALVAAQQAAGYDFLKTVSRLTPEAYRALAAAAERHGMVLTGHVQYSVGVDGALAVRQRSIEHLDGYLAALVPPGPPLPSVDDPQWMRAVLARVDAGRLPGLVQRTLDAGTWNCPTLVVYDRAPELHSAQDLAQHMQWSGEISAARRARWSHGFAAAHPSADDAATARAANAQLARIVAALAAAGAPLLVGTDTGGPFVIPGEALHEEIERLVAAGVPRPRVLRAATADAWRYFGKPHEAGVIEVGARADLLLVASDPLAAALPLIPDGVMVRGRWLPRADLTARLADIARRDAPPGDRWASAAPLAADGEAVRRAEYDIAIGGTPVAAERLAVGRAAGHRTIAGQIFDPEDDVETTYRLGPDRATVTAVHHMMKLDIAAARARGALVVTGTDLTGAPVSLRAPAPAGAVLSIPGIGGTVAIADQLAGLPPGARRTVLALELDYFPRIAIVAVRHAIERKPDVGGNRVFRIATKRAEASVTSEVVADRDGLFVTQVDGPPVDTVATRRPR